MEKKNNIFIKDGKLTFLGGLIIISLLFSIL
mgnify:CR=1 FL=1